MSTLNLLKLGSTGTAVKALQKALFNLGYGMGKNSHYAYNMAIDGHYGKRTQRAVMAFQKSVGLLADGIAGKRTRSHLQLIKGESVQPYHLTDNDVRSAARMLKVSIAVIRTVSEVESNGDGFIAENRPKILFERHWMSRMLKRYNLNALRTTLLKKQPNICNTKTGGYRGGMHEWTRFNKAAKFHEDSAICSASWGRYQIMGFHYEDLNFTSPKAFKDSMCKDEGEHLKAFVKFIRNDPKLHNALKELDWETFARIYNGKGYAKNKYDMRLAAAYSRYTNL